jgi:hypothetical protein
MSRNEIFNLNNGEFIQLTHTVSSNEMKFLRSKLYQNKEYRLPVPVIGISQNGVTIPFLTLKSFVCAKVNRSQKRQLL